MDLALTSRLGGEGDGVGIAAGLEGLMNPQHPLQGRTGMQRFFRFRLHARQLMARFEIQDQVILESSSSLVLCFFKAASKRLHGLDRVEVHHHAAELANGLDVFGREKFFLLARAALGDVQGGEEPAVGELAVQDQFHVAGAFELLENQFVHARAGVHQGGGDDGQRAALLDLAGGGEHLARNFQRAGIHAAGHGAAAAAMDAVVGAGDAGDGIQQDKNVPPAFDHAAAALDDEAGEADVGFQVLVVGGGDDLGLDGALEIGDFLRALVNQQDHGVDFGVIGGDGVGDLLEDGRLARARRGDDQPARAFADGRDQVNDARFQQIGRGFQVDLLDGINGGEVLEADGLGVDVKGLVVDLVDGFELGAVAAVGRLGFAGDQAAFAQEVALDGVGRDEDVAGFGMIVVLAGAKETKALFGDFKKACPWSVALWRWALCSYDD